MILKQGKKWKAESLLKQSFKRLQKNCRKKNSLPLIKNAIVINARGSSLNKQTLKKGKRKKVIQTTVLLVSEKARFSDSWKTLIKSVSNKPFDSQFCFRLSKKIVDSNKTSSNNNRFIPLINKKHGLKFKW